MITTFNRDVILSDFFGVTLSPLEPWGGGGGAVGPSLPCFLPLTQNYLEAPIPENSRPWKPFCCGCPYEKKIRNLVLLPSQITLKYGSENRPWVKRSVLWTTSSGFSTVKSAEQMGNFLQHVLKVFDESLPHAHLAER